MSEANRQWSLEGDPVAQDFVRADGKYWVVWMVVCGTNRYVCFRDGVRRTFERCEIEQYLKQNFSWPKTKTGKSEWRKEQKG